MGKEQKQENYEQRPQLCDILEKTAAFCGLAWNHQVIKEINSLYVYYVLICCKTMTSHGTVWYKQINRLIFSLGVYHAHGRLRRKYT